MNAVPAEASQTAPAVDIADMRFGYRSDPDVLDIQQLQVESAERVFLYGPSGSGKSTLLALIGGVLAVFLTDGVLSIATLMGFVTLFGIATRNGVLLVSNYQRLLAAGLTLAEAVRRGSEERLAPILMTALTAGLALVPLILAGDAPGNEIQSPMARVILGGLLTSTFLNLVLVPVLYERWGRR